MKETEILNAIDLVCLNCVEDTSRKTLLFREQEIQYYTNWLDDDTFELWFGEDIFVDSEGDEYFIHIEYHLDDDEWVTEIYFEEEFVLIEDFINPDKYITKKEIEEIKKIAIKEMKIYENDSSDIRKQEKSK